MRVFRYYITRKENNIDKDIAFVKQSIILKYPYDRKNIGDYFVEHYNKFHSEKADGFRIEPSDNDGIEIKYLREPIFVKIK